MNVDFIDESLNEKGKRVFYINRSRVDELLNIRDETPIIVAIKHYRDLGGDLDKVAIYTEVAIDVGESASGKPIGPIIETHSVREKEMR